MWGRKKEPWKRKVSLQRRNEAHRYSSSGSSRGKGHGRSRPRAGDAPARIKFPLKLPSPLATLFPRNDGEEWKLCILARSLSLSHILSARFDLSFFCKASANSIYPEGLRPNDGEPQKRAHLEIPAVLRDVDEALNVALRAKSAPFSPRQANEPTNERTTEHSAAIELEWGNGRGHSGKKVSPANENVYHPREVRVRRRERHHFQGRRFNFAVVNAACYERFDEVMMNSSTSCVPRLHPSIHPRRISSLARSRRIAQDARSPPHKSRRPLARAHSHNTGRKMLIQPITLGGHYAETCPSQRKSLGWK